MSTKIKPSAKAAPLPGAYTGTVGPNRALYVATDTMLYVMWNSLEDGISHLQHATAWEIVDNTFTPEYKGEIIKVSIRTSSRDLDNC